MGLTAGDGPGRNELSFFFDGFRGGGGKQKTKTNLHALHALRAVQLQEALVQQEPGIRGLVIHGHHGYPAEPHGHRVHVARADVRRLRVDPRQVGGGPSAERLLAHCLLQLVGLM